MNKYLFDVLIFVVIVCISLITRYAVPWLKSQVHESQYAEVVDMVAQAVRTAEQIMQGSLGSAKKEYVLEFLHFWIDTMHISISEEQLNALIEAAVYAMKQDQFYD